LDLQTDDGSTNAARCINVSNAKAALKTGAKVRNRPSLLAQHDPLAEHAATDQMLAESLLYRVSATQLISAIEIDGLASTFTFGLFTCQFTLTTNGFFFSRAPCELTASRNVL